MLMVNIANGATELLKCGSIRHLRARSEQKLVAFTQADNLH